MIWDLLLADIRLEESPQVRCAIDDAVVADYANQMQADAAFPPITVFSDVGGLYRLADGHHRYLAAQRIGRTTIAADILAGTRQDALWFALGANRAHGQRLTLLDKTRAVALALEAWPEKMQHAIATQIGCSPSLVSKTATRLASRAEDPGPLRGRRLQIATLRKAIRERILAGETSIGIKQAIRANSSTIAAVRRELAGAVGLPATMHERHAQIREMAGAGYTSPQIAAAVGLSLEGCREQVRRLGVVVHGDRVTRGLHRHDSNRIMAQIVADASNLSAGANFIDFTALDRSQFADWVETLRAARTMLGTFIRRLTKEQVMYDDGEVAEKAVEDSSGPDRTDARPAGAGGPA